MLNFSSVYAIRVNLPLDVKKKISYLADPQDNQVNAIKRYREDVIIAEIWHNQEKGENIAGISLYFAEKGTVEDFTMWEFLLSPTPNAHEILL